MSKQFVNDVASIAILATRWHEVPMPPLEGEVPNEREAEGFVRHQSVKTPRPRYALQHPFRGSRGHFVPVGQEPKDWYRVRSGIKNKFTNEGLDFSDTRWYSVFSTQRERVLRKEDGSWN